jgi:SAM-dependent methyltransferase
MINLLHAFLHDPARGWDPVPGEHADGYAERAWEDLKPSLVDEIEARIGKLHGKRVLDLGGGPGQYSVEMARRGARVVWHDVSRRYGEMVRRRAAEAGVDLETSIGYLEDARKFLHEPFDLVFCRLCWNYCRGDRAFARLAYRLTRPDGALYVETNTETFGAPAGLRRLIYLFNALLGWKIGHPYPPGGRVPRLLLRFPVRYAAIEYPSPLVERILLIRQDEPG